LEKVSIEGPWEDETINRVLIDPFALGVASAPFRNYCPAGRPLKQLHYLRKHERRHENAEFLMMKDEGNLLGEGNA
jgi:hypothetical protein